MLSRRSKVLGVALTLALVLGLLIPLTYPSLLGLFASLFYYLVAIPALFLKLFLHGRSKQQYRRQGRGLHNQYAPSSRYRNSRVISQTTRNGEVVKSGGERMIADYLYANGIRYEYEKPAMDLEGKRISRPDFFLPDYGVYIEYWGMLNSDEKHERQAYLKSMEWKISRYQKSGNKFISIYPQDLRNLDSVLKTKLQNASQV